MLHIPSDDYIARNIQNINSKQRIVLNICHIWEKGYMKALIDHIHVFSSSGAGT